MKFVCAWILAAFFAAGFTARAATSDDTYLRIYQAIQEADQLRAAGQSDAARQRYLQAQADLLKLKEVNPNWNPKIVDYRLQNLQEKLATMSGAAPSQPTVTPSARPAVAPPAAPTRPAEPAAPDERDAKIQGLTQQAQALTAANQVLEEKLKEALAARPAAIDPQELAKAEAKIKNLEKEKELLQVSLQQEQEKAKTLPDAAGLDKVKSELAAALQQLGGATNTVAALQQERKMLEARLHVASAQGEEASKAIRAENEALKNETAELKQKLASATLKAETPPQEAAALAALKQEKENWLKEKASLEAKLTAKAAPPKTSDQSAQIKKLEQERDDLLKKLEAAAKTGDKAEKSRPAPPLQISQLTNQLAILRARLEVFEARKAPFSPEELALLKKSEPALATPDPKGGRRSIKEMPAGSGPLLAEAQRAFAARRFDEAERKYVQILKMDEKNSLTLANLAVIQLEQNKFQEAEESLQKALAIDPNDGFALCQMGKLRLQQTKHQEALDFLSRGSQSDPSNPEIQNYLGIVLGELGQRGPAEAAFRKAVQLAPGHAGAHHNLALIYATQQPAYPELAKYHYQKALSAGHPQNADLEKVIEGKK